MKNIHLIPTDKPSRLLYFGTSKELTLQVNLATFRTFERSTQHIYITSDEETKEGDYFLYDETEIRYKTNGTEYHGRDLCHISGNRRYPVNKSKKIILTTDQDLINNGVQEIDNEFLEWFVKNPSCEEVEVERGYLHLTGWVKSEEEAPKNLIRYKIIIPKEEPKQTDEKGGPITFREGIEESKYIMGIDPYDKQEIVKDLVYWKANAEEDYMKVPISVLRYISELEKQKYSEEDLREAFKQSRQGKIFEKDMPPVYENFEEWFEQLKKK